VTDEQPTPEIRILGGNPSTAEIAAVTAVLTTALDELAGESRRSRDRGLSAWRISQRAIRRPLPHGAWRNVEG
jgi:acyl-CoA carboxylase epsilon subunit-like protein